MAFCFCAIAVSEFICITKSGETMENFTPYSAFFGGTLIGISASMLMLLNGRIAGISGIVKGLLKPSNCSEINWRIAFLAGLVFGGLGYAMVFPVQITLPQGINMLTLIIGGLLVGFGTAMGNGCTSGHGVCGMSRFSIRSIVATMTFLSTGMLTVYIIRHVLGE